MSLELKCHILKSCSSLNLLKYIEIRGNFNGQHLHTENKLVTVKILITLIETWNLKLGSYRI